MTANVLPSRLARRRTTTRSGAGQARTPGWLRTRAFASLAQVLLDVRLVAGLLSLSWAWIDGQHPVLLLCMTCWMLATLGMLLRWHRFAAAAISHPLLHLADLVAVAGLLGATGPLSPVAFLLLSGGLFTGLCLGRLGAWFFAPGYVLAWLVAVTRGLPAETGSSLGFLALVVTPVILVAMLFGGAAMRAAIIAAAELESNLHHERETAAVAEERARLARELHDSVTKSLYGMAMLADTLPSTIESSPELAMRRAADLATAARTATAESRELLVAMRRADVRAGVDELLRATCDRWQATTGRDLTLRSEHLGRVDPATLYELGAIVNEALENVSRHTPAEAAVTITGAVRHGWLEITVSDTGPGMTTDRATAAVRSGHLGLVGMRERAARVGALFDLDSAPGRGTTVSLRVPREASEDD
ncbi:sensor histidine kinase [Nocardioides sp.]|uniref:sensor histidine kinase n=1 Tax=Nocardioides sp. TaxID=35761 RepID=UPI0039E4E225